MRILGLMSGSSLDGLDMAVCEFFDDHTFTIVKSKTVPFPDSLVTSFKRVFNMSVIDYLHIEASFNAFVVDAINSFIRSQDKVDLIVSHGHTIYHNPQAGISEQIGNGGMLAAQTGIDVLCDLRMQDVALGGQGAPLASIADFHLFTEYDILVNLGGILNLSIIDKQDNLKSWDVGPCNQVFNYLSLQLGHPFDKDGKFAKKGKVNRSVLEGWRNYPYFSQIPPKSVDNGWVQRQFIHKMNLTVPIEDLLATAVEFCASQLAKDISPFVNQLSKKRMMLAGGGAHNDFLVKKIRKHLQLHGVEVVVPGDDIVDYKESVLMAYMGYRYLQRQHNTISSATGARTDIIAGAYYLKS